MSWFRIFMLLSILLSIATTSSPARSHGLVAQNNPAPNRNFQVPAGGVGSLVKELNLSPDQIQRLQQLRIGNQGKNKQRRERRQALKIAKQELAQLLQGNASPDQIRQKRQQVQSIQREVADINFENTLAIREILTPEQRVKLQQLMQQRRQNRGKLE
jgi:periplasmic protein CpxP/Spy